MKTKEYIGRVLRTDAFANYSFEISDSDNDSLLYTIVMKSSNLVDNERGYYSVQITVNIANIITKIERVKENIISVYVITKFPEIVEKELEDLLSIASSEIVNTTRAITKSSSTPEIWVLQLKAAYIVKSHPYYLLYDDNLDIQKNEVTFLERRGSKYTYITIACNIVTRKITGFACDSYKESGTSSHYRSTIERCNITKADKDAFLFYFSAIATDDEEKLKKSEQKWKDKQKERTAAAQEEKKRRRQATAAALEEQLTNDEAKALKREKMWANDTENAKKAILAEITVFIMQGRAKTAKATVTEALEHHISSNEIWHEGCTKVFSMMLDQYKQSKIHVPDLIIAGRAMKAVYTMLIQQNGNGIFASGIIIGMPCGSFFEGIEAKYTELTSAFVLAGFRVIDLFACDNPETYISEVQKSRASVILLVKTLSGWLYTQSAEANVVSIRQSLDNHPFDCPPKIVCAGVLDGDENYIGDYASIASLAINLMQDRML